jgi:hypothetical protein
MRGTYGDRLAGLRLQPALQRPTARKYERVRTLAVDHGKLDFGVEGRGMNGQPHAGKFSQPTGRHIDLAQIGCQCRGTAIRPLRPRLRRLI